MKNKRIFVVGLLVTVLASGGFLIALNVAGHQTAFAKNNIATDSQGDSITQVSLKDNKATPDTVTAVVGHTVQFNVADGKIHDMAMGEGSAGGHVHNHEGGYESGDFGANEAWKVQFKKIGNYFFHDHNNPNINVLVVVYEYKV